ncbi:MAG: hypothetical protein KAS40_23890, partial [Desulfobacterales bacterium]|nr:hypothetical protein [Desulfobacterales bacterium]
DRIEKFLESKASDIKERSMHRRKKYFIDGVEVELVRPIDNSHFCANCTRLRVTSDGPSSVRSTWMFLKKSLNCARCGVSGRAL